LNFKVNAGEKSKESDVESGV